jgi:hypothetical protein
VCANVIRLETIQKEKNLEKARLIAAAKQIRRSEVNHNIWLLDPGSPKTSKRFHDVKRNEGLDCFVSDCKVLEISMSILYKRIYGCAIFEGANA